MKLILQMILLGLVLSISGCEDSPEIPTSFQGEQCSPEFAPAVLDEIDGKWYIPAETSVCRCRQYRIDKDRIGPVLNENGNVTVIRKPIQECNLIKGYKPAIESKLWEVLDWWRVQIKKWIEENEQEKPIMEDRPRAEAPGNR